MHLRYHDGFKEVVIDLKELMHCTFFIASHAQEMHFKPLLILFSHISLNDQQRKLVTYTHCGQFCHELFMSPQFSVEGFVQCGQRTTGTSSSLTTSTSHWPVRLREKKVLM